MLLGSCRLCSCGQNDLIWDQLVLSATRRVLIAPAREMCVQADRRQKLQEHQEHSESTNFDPQYPDELLRSRPLC